MTMDKDYALIIGINDYTDLNDLNGPINDANKFQQWVLSPEGGNVPADNCYLVTSKSNPYEPEQIDIDERLSEIYQKGQVTGYRRFYFFFAGHGLGPSWNENALCLPKWSSIFRNYALSSAEYLKLIVESGMFQEVFFFLDCCRNRVVASIPARPYISWVRPGDGVANCSSFVAYATSYDNAALEAAMPDPNGIQTQGYFTKALMQGLNGAAANASNGNITTSSLKGFLVDTVSQISSHQQSVRFEDNFTNEGIINSLDSELLVELVLRFTEDGQIMLEGPNLELIKQEDSSKWPKSLKVPKGLYNITNKTTGKEAFIRIELSFNDDQSIKPLLYEF